MGNNSLVSIDLLPEAGHITVIGARAFKGCTKLYSILLPASLTTIEDEAFSGCDLASVIIPGSVASIGDYAFYNCSSLAEVFYAGSAADWSSITVGEGNDHLTSATRYFYSEEEPTESGNYWHYVDGVPTVW